MLRFAVTLLVALCLTPYASAAEVRPLGRIVIPRIGLDMSYYQGITESVLSHGPGHYEDTAMPCGQNSTTGIAGHRTWAPHPFNRVLELRIGDPIKVSFMDKKCIYRVVHTYIVRPWETWMFRPPVGNAQRIVLSACAKKDGTPTSWAYRVVVLARRVA